MHEVIPNYSPGLIHLDKRHIACGEAVATCTAHGTCLATSVERDPGCLDALCELIMEFVLQLCNPRFVTLKRQRLALQSYGT